MLDFCFVRKEIIQMAISAGTIIYFANLLAKTIRTLLNLKNAVNINAFINNQAKALFTYTTAHFSPEINERLGAFFKKLSELYNPVITTKNYISNQLNSTVAKVRVDDMIRSSASKILRPIDEFIKAHPNLILNEDVIQLLKELDSDVVKVVNNTLNKIKQIQQQVEQNQIEEFERVSKDEIEQDEIFEEAEEIVKEFEEKNDVVIPKEEKRYSDELPNYGFDNPSNIDDWLRHTPSENRMLIIAYEAVRDQLEYYLSLGIISREDMAKHNYFARIKAWLSEYVTQLSDSQKHNYLKNNLVTPLVNNQLDQWLAEDGLIYAVESD